MKRPSAHLSAARAAVSHHRRNKRSLEQAASKRSRYAFDWMNFFVADVQQGFGPFIAYYLANLGWSQASIGLMLTISQVTSAATLIPGGALTDAVRWKRALVAGGICMLAGAALIFALHPTRLFVIFAEVMQGGAAGILTPAIAAISLGLVGRRGMSSRIGRNQRFQAAGTALTAGIMGALGNYLAKNIIFLTAAGLAVPALVALGFISKDEIDYDRARNAGKDKEGRPTLHGLTVLLKNRQLFWFACCAALFQLADASMLALAVEDIGRSDAKHSSLITSGLIVAPQIVAALLAPWIAYVSELRGRRPILLVSFGVEIARAASFVFVSDPIFLIVVQTLNGISGAVWTVLTAVVIADLTSGTGRFNIAVGAVGLVMALSASVSTASFGFVAQALGPAAAFLGMAAVAAAGGFVVWFMLNESKPGEYGD